MSGTNTDSSNNHGNSQISDQVSEDRLSNVAIKNVDELVQKIKSYYPNLPENFIERVYSFSEKAHEGQMRRSGEPYIIHPLNVAGILAELHLDVDTIATGLLHDTVEDTEATLADIQKGLPKLLFSSGISGELFSTDPKFGYFERKYGVQLVDFGCTLPAFLCIEAYTSVVFEYLDKKFGKEWRNEVPKEALGID